jgi:hypothetical protein
VVAIALAIVAFFAEAKATDQTKNTSEVASREMFRLLAIQKKAARTRRPWLNLRRHCG